MPSGSMKSGLKAYIRDNTPRPEPVREAHWTAGGHQVRTSDGRKRNSRLSPRKADSPKPPGIGTKFNEEGVPVDETVMLWAPELVRSWVNQVHGLAVTGR